MAVDPITATVASGLLMLVFDGLRSSEKKPENTAPRPPVIPPNMVHTFTHVRGNIQFFDKDISANTPRVLWARSAQLEPVDPQSALAQVGRVWRIVPFQAGLPRASDLITEAWRHGEVPLASLSLVLVPTGRSDWPAIVVIGPKGCEQFAGRGSHFAVLEEPKVEPVKVQAEEPEPKPEPKPEPRPEPKPEPRPEAKKPNGSTAAVIDAKATVIDTTAVESE